MSGEKKHRSASRKTLDWIAPGGITLLAAALRMWNLDRTSFWTDELMQLGVVTLPTLRESLSILQTHVASMPLDFLIGRFWIGIAGGNTETILRLWPVFVGTLTVPAIYLFGKRLGGKVEGLLAAFLLAISPFHVAYSREFRFYSLFCLLATLLVWAFLRMLSEPKRREPAVTFVALAFLCWHTHVYTAILLAGLFLVFLADAVRNAGEEGIPGFWNRNKRGFLFLAILLAAAMSLSLPWFLYDTIHEIGKGATDYGYHEPYSLLFFVDIFFHLSGRSLAGILIFTAAAIFGVISSLSRGRPLPLFLLVAIILMLCIQTILNSLRGYQLILRQCIYLCPIWIVLASHGILLAFRGIDRKVVRSSSRIPCVFAGVLFLLFVTLFHLPGLKYIFTLREREDWRGTCHVLQNLMKDRDDILVVRHFSRYMKHYWPDVESRLWEQEFISEDTVSLYRGEGRRVFIFFKETFLLPGYIEEQMRELESFPQLRLDLWSKARLVCIPPEEGDAVWGTLDDFLSRLGPWKHESAFIPASLARECLGRGFEANRVDDLLKRAIETDQASPAILTGLINTLLSQGERDRAMDLLQVQERYWRLEARTSFRERGYRLVDLAVAVQKQGRGEEGVHILRKALQSAPARDRDYFRFRLGEGLMRNNPGSEEATALLREAAKSLPERDYIWLALARSLQNRRMWPELIETLGKAVKACPHVAPELVPFAGEGMKRISENRNLEETRRSSFERILARILNQGDPETKRIQESISEIRKLLEVCRGEPVVLVTVGFLDEDRDLRDAMAELEGDGVTLIASRDIPGFIKKRKAWSSETRIFIVGPQSLEQAGSLPVKKCGAFRMGIVGKMVSGWRGIARTVLPIQVKIHERRVGSVSPGKAAWSWFMLAHLSQSLPEHQLQTLECLKNAVALAPGEATFSLALARRLLFLKKPEEALKPLTALEKRQPDNVEALLLKGRVLLSLGRKEEAAAAFARAREIDPETGSVP